MNRVEPLFDVFLALRELLSLSVSDYRLAQEALAHGFAAPSRDELREVCQILWGKDREQQKLVAHVLDSYLPPRWSNVEKPQGELDTVAIEKTVPLDAPLPELHNQCSGPPTTAGADKLIEMKELAVLPREGAAAIQILGRERTKPTSKRRSSVPLSLEGDLPVSRRHMQRAWRYYRRLRRDGPAVEIDVPATVREIHRSGVFHTAVLLPRRRNFARLLILLDSGGSMIPFERETAPLLETARSREAGLASVAAAWFHDVPGPTLFHDRARLIPIDNLAAFTEPFWGAGILIVSDAGAARGNDDMQRAAATVCELDRLRTITPHVAWVNPTPQERWRGNTAERIQGHVPMFPLDRAGLDRAVNVLRGRRTR